MGHFHSQLLRVLVTPGGDVDNDGFLPLYKSRCALYLTHGFFPLRCYRNVIGKKNRVTCGFLMVINGNRELRRRGRRPSRG